jgi:hypothetical protein
MEEREGPSNEENSWRKETEKKVMHALFVWHGEEKLCLPN